MIYLNLAPFRYRDILNASDSPIERIDVLEFNEKTSTYYEVHGWLKGQYKFSEIEKSNIYGSCDATGTDKYLHIATWKCISELIERWAFHHLLLCESDSYGIDTDKTTTGFAALPCWPKGVVRKVAYGEALERWAISNWWRGKLGGSIDRDKKLLDEGVGILKLNVPKEIGSVVITFKKSISNMQEFYCYGFAYGSDLEMAVAKASIEMLRNERVLAARDNSELTSINDKRLGYFSTEVGFQHFLSNVKPPVDLYIGPPKPIVDCEVLGEWSRFATVWRCLLPGTYYNWSDEKHFMF